MMKRVLSMVMCLVMVVGLLPMIALVDTSTVSAASNYEDASGNVNNTTYTLGAGTDAEVSVIADWRSTSMSPTGTITPQYVMVHNTGTYVGSASAKNVHNNTNKTSSSACWHYTVDSNEIYQGLADSRRGWHSATSYTNYPSNVNSIGIEMCVNNFPQTIQSGETNYDAFDNEDWSNGTAIMDWWKNEFDQTMKHTAYLCVVLCERWGLNWQTDIVMHWDAWQYSVSSKSGKDCPMQMRATYDAATNTFTEAGTYADGRDGYFWQIFWGYVEAYANGATSVGTTTVAPKIGTYKITPSEGLNVRESASSTATKLTTLEMGEIVEITELDSNGWGKVTLDDGTEGWCSIVAYGEYIGVDAQAYELGANSSGVTYAYDTDGGLILTNNASEQGQIDLYTPVDIGTATTPYMSLQVTPIWGNGYYFGITQKGSGYWMMRDCSSGDQLVVEESAPYMTGTETLEINVGEWWKPSDGQRINHVRFYLAPTTSIKVNYFYFAATSGAVVDERYNLRAAATNVTLMQPDSITVGDTSKSGSYKYSNGMLTVTADTDAGFDVVFNINETFDVNTLKRLLVGIEAYTSFNVTLTLTNANGVGTVSLASDYCYDFTETFPEDGMIPGPFEGTRGLDLYNYFAYNNIIPSDGMSTITKVTVSLGSAGTSYFNSIQIAENDRIMVFRDGVVKEGSNTPSDDKIVIESDVYTLREDGILSGVTAGTDVTALLGNIKSDYTVTVYENGTAVDGTAVAKTGLVIKVTDGTTELASYEVAVIGDVNGDGEKSTADARAILSSLTVTPLSGVYAVAADLSGSGSVDSSSARQILMELITA